MSIAENTEQHDDENETVMLAHENDMMNDGEDELLVLSSSHSELVLQELTNFEENQDTYTNQAIRHEKKK